MNPKRTILTLAFAPAILLAAMLPMDCAAPAVQVAAPVVQVPPGAVQVQATQSTQPVVVVNIARGAVQVLAKYDAAQVPANVWYLSAGIVGIGLLLATAALVLAIVWHGRRTQ